MTTIPRYIGQYFLFYIRKTVSTVKSYKFIAIENDSFECIHTVIMDCEFEKKIVIIKCIVYECDMLCTRLNMCEKLQLILKWLIKCTFFQHVENVLLQKSFL